MCKLLQVDYVMISAQHLVCTNLIVEVLELWNYLRYLRIFDQSIFAIIIIAVVILFRKVKLNNCLYFQPITNSFGV